MCSEGGAGIPTVHPVLILSAGCSHEHVSSLYAQDTALAQIPMGTFRKEAVLMGTDMAHWAAVAGRPTWGALHGPLGTMPPAITDLGFRMPDAHPASATHLDGALVMPLPLCRPHFP